MDIIAREGRAIPIGRLGENEHIRIVFDVSEWLALYPEASFTLLNKLPQTLRAYPVATAARDGEAVYWTVTAADLSREGKGKCELIVYQGGVIAKSVIYDTEIRHALDGSGPVPEGWESWQQVFAALKNDAETAQRLAQAARDDILAETDTEWQYKTRASNTGISYSNGGILFGKQWCHATDKRNCRGKDKIVLPMIVPVSNSSAVDAGAGAECGLAFYDEIGYFLSGVNPADCEGWPGEADAHGEVFNTSIDIPEGAAKFATTFWGDGGTVVFHLIERSVAGKIEKWSEKAEESANDAAQSAEEAAQSAEEAAESKSAIDELRRKRVASLDSTPLAVGTVIEAVGEPVYVRDVTPYSAYGITEKGWYVFARISAPEGVTVTNATTITGAAGQIITVGAAYVDVAVRFGVTAQSQTVAIDWGESAESFVFKANDLAVRNLDYRTTFYLYDLDEFVTWEYALTTDTAFVANKAYYTMDGDAYTPAEVTTGETIPAYYTLADETYTQATGVFEAGVTYYTKSGDTYSEAAVTVGDSIPAYYTHSKVTFAGMTRNVTYKLDTMVDCPIEIVLPEVDDEGYGAWYEFQLRYFGSHSCTLLPPTGVKVGTVTTQAQTAGINVIDLQYTGVSGVKMWSLLNTHSNIPA